MQTSPALRAVAAVAASAVALLLALGAAPPARAGSHERVLYLDQGWSPDQRERFYFTPQGSRLFPYDWFLALEVPDAERLFASRDNLARFGWSWHADDSGRLNPGGLPIGFTREPAAAPGGGRWMGLTCAACHTATVRHGGHVLRIDGGPSLSDFGAFLGALSRAVTASHPGLDEERFERFADRVLGQGADDAARHALATAYTRFAVRFVGQATMRTPALEAGPGRVDALTQIVNALAVFDLGIAENLRPPAAPTSYPFLWYTPRLAWVQWNPIAANPMARNLGQVLGVFGDANLGRDPSRALFDSSVLLANLHAIEQWLERLEPPRWPEELFGAIDEARWRRGAALFKSNCRGCHNMPPFDLTAKEDNIAGRQFIVIKRIPYRRVGTDPLYVESLGERFVRTGPLAAPLFDGADVVPAALFFTRTVSAVLDRSLERAALTPQKLLAYNGHRFHPKQNPADPDEPLRSYSPPSFTGLKAGPLLGIWATGPFLHNGSVPNVYELLSPPEERPAEFQVGSDELDLQRLGFVSTAGYGRFRFDTRLPGNGNSGHRYPRRPLAHPQRLDLIEYLKDPLRFAGENGGGED